MLHEGRRLCDLQVHGAESPKLRPFFHRRREWWGAAGVQRNEVPNHAHLKATRLALNLTPR